MIFKIAVICLLASLVSLMLKGIGKEYSILVQICAVLVVITLVITYVSKSFEGFFAYVEQLTVVKQAVSVMLKTAVICVMTHFVYDLCRESGNSAIADAVEFGGRLVALVLAMPLIRELLKTAVSFVK